MNINTWLESKDKEPWDPEFGPDLPDFDLSDMLDGKINSTSAAKIWTKIASGEADVLDTLLWVQHVAGMITKNVMHARGTSSERERAALRAIGFYGPVDVYREAKEWMQLISDFGPIDEHGEPQPKFRITGNEWVTRLRRSGHLAGVDDKTALNRVLEWRKEFGIE